MEPRQYLDTIGLFSHNPHNGVGMWPAELTLLESLLPKTHYTFCEVGSHNGGSLLISHFHRTANNLSGIDIAIDPNFSPYFDLNMRRARCYPKKCVGTIDDLPQFLSTIDDDWEIPQQFIDVALVDGMHSFRDILKDYYGLKPYLKQDAKILFHDVSPRVQDKYKRKEILEWTLSNLDYLNSLDYEDFYVCEAYCYLEHVENLEHIDCKIDCFHPHETGLTSWIRSKTSPSSALAALKFKG